MAGRIGDSGGLPGSGRGSCRGRPRAYREATAQPDRPSGAHHCPAVVDDPQYDPGERAGPGGQDTGCAPGSDHSPEGDGVLDDSGCPGVFDPCLVCGHHYHRACDHDSHNSRQHLDNDSGHDFDDSGHDFDG